MTALTLQTTALVLAAFTLGALAVLYFRTELSKLCARVTFLEDENRWLRAELEIVVPGMKPARTGDQMRALCEADEHTAVIGDPNCIYCGAQVLDGNTVLRSGTLFTNPPHDFPQARLVTKFRGHK